MVCMAPRPTASIDVVGGTDISFVSPVRSILELTIDDVSMNGLPVPSVRVSEVAGAGVIILK
jgi:hypothetical protein